MLMKREIASFQLSEDLMQVGLSLGKAMPNVMSGRLSVVADQLVAADVS